MVREHRDTRQRQLAGGEQLGAGLVDLLELGRDGAIDDGCRHALLIELTEQLPGLLAELLRHGLDEPGATGWVVDATDVRLLGQHHLGVAGDASGQDVGKTDRGVQRQHRDGLRLADGRREGRDGAAQHVDVGVVAGDLPQRGDSVLHRSTLFRGHPEYLADPVPQGAQCAQSGDGDELVGVRRNPEQDAVEGFVGAQTEIGEGTHVLDARGQRVGQLRDVTGAHGVVAGGIHDDGTHTREGLGQLHGLRDHRQVRGGAVQSGETDRVNAEATTDVLLAGRGESCGQCLGGSQLVGVGGNVGGGEVEQNIAQDLS